MFILALGSRVYDRSLLGIKQTEAIPNVNRGCPPLTANRASSKCMQTSLWPTIRYIILGLFHAGSFNAMTNTVQLGLGHELMITYIVCLWDLIIQPYQNVNSGLAKQQLAFGHGWIIIFHMKQLMLLSIHTLMSLQVLFISVGIRGEFPLPRRSPRGQVSA